MQFILLATLLLMVVAQALLLVQESFPFYPFGAPTGPATPKTPREVENAGTENPVPPDEQCTFNGQTREQVWRTMAAKGGPSAADKKMLERCEAGNWTLRGLVLTIDMFALLLTTVAVVTTLMLTGMGCAQGAALGGYLGVMIGCFVGFAEGAAISTGVLRWASIAGGVAAFLACVDESFAYHACRSSFLMAIVGFKIPDPVSSAAWDLYVLCLDAGHRGLRECMSRD